MTLFWTAYITVLTLGSLVALVWLIVSTSKGQPTGTVDQAMDHTWDGISEYDNPLPRWWFMLFIGGIIFAVIYLIIYPGLGGWKGLHPGYQGGWTQEKQWENEMAKADAKYEPIFAKYRQMSIVELANDPDAVKMGSGLFATYCSICHGTDARGFVGFPNLTDTIWRWGGKPEDIQETITNGRQAIMTPWGEMLGEQRVRNVAAYIRQEFAKLPSQAPDADLNEGKNTFNTICIACHMADGKGNQLIGSGDLTQPAGWIYGTSQAIVEQTVTHGRMGQMPAQGPILGADKVHILAGYVYSLSKDAR